MDWQDDEPKAGTPLWYLTFSDLMALLVGFFILLFGFSSLEANRFQKVADSMREAFGGARASATAPTPAPAAIAPAPSRMALGPDRAAIYERAQALLSAQRLGPLVQTDLEERGVRLRVDGALLFGGGGATLRPEALPFLDRVARLAMAARGTVVVEGHTDDAPVRFQAFPSNWELAGARAGAVVRRLASCGLPASRLEAVAYADTRPVAPNRTEEGRRRNRRVEILIHTEE